MTKDDYNFSLEERQQMGHEMLEFLGDINNTPLPLEHTVLSTYAYEEYAQMRRSQRRWTKANSFMAYLMAAFLFFIPLGVYRVASDFLSEDISAFLMGASAIILMMIIAFVYAFNRNNRKNRERMQEIIQYAFKNPEVAFNVAEGLISDEYDEEFWNKLSKEDPGLHHAYRLLIYATAMIDIKGQDGMPTRVIVMNDLGAGDLPLN